MEHYPDLQFLWAALHDQGGWDFDMIATTLDKSAVVW